LSNNSAYNFWGISSIHMKKKKNFHLKWLLLFSFVTSRIRLFCVL
jgi:hypothetical protein